MGRDKASLQVEEDPLGEADKRGHSPGGQHSEWGTTALSLSPGRGGGEAGRKKEGRGEVEQSVGWEAKGVPFFTKETGWWEESSFKGECVFSGALRPGGLGAALGQEEMPEWGLRWGRAPCHVTNER